MKKYFDYLTGETIYSPTVISIAGIWSVWTHILAPSPDIHGNIYLRIIFAAISIAPTISIIFVYRLLTKNRTRKLVGVLGTILVASAVRGLTLAILFTKFGITKNYNLVFRIPNATVLISFALIVSTLLVAGYREQHEIMFRLRREKNQLIAAVNQLQGKYSSPDAILAKNISDLLMAEISKIDFRTAKDAIESIRNLIEDTVRPISHNLAKLIPSWEHGEFDVRPDRLSMRQVLQSITPETGINIRILTLLMSLQIFPFISIYGFSAVLRIIIVILLTFPLMLKFAQIVLLQVSKTFSLVARIISLILILGLAPLPTCGIIFFIIKGSSNPYYFFQAGPSFTILAAGLISVANSIQTASKIIKIDLENTNAELAWIIARINLSIWNYQGIIVQNLHGRIQSELHASVFELKEIIDSGDDSSVFVSDLQKRIRQSVENLIDNKNDQVRIEDMFNQIVETWRNICQVSFEYNNQELRSLEGDNMAQNALVQIIRESVSNAVRHANATLVNINIKKVERIIVVSIKNNGDLLSSSFNKGLGMTVLDSITVDHDFLVLGNETELRANIPTCV